MPRSRHEKATANSCEQRAHECIDEAHRDGAIVDVIQRDLSRFVLKDPDLAATLHKLRSAGKNLFLLTNWRWRYTDAMMTYLLEGMMSEYPSWRSRTGTVAGEM
jgi:hypothetical protein